MKKEGEMASISLVAVPMNGGDGVYSYACNSTFQVVFQLYTDSIRSDFSSTFAQNTP